jgi:hypothetical protein
MNSDVNWKFSKGGKVSDAYCQLVFEDNDAYFFKVKSASKKGNWKVKTSQKAEGTCKNMNQPPKNETLENNVDISLHKMKIFLIAICIFAISPILKSQESNDLSNTP